MSSVRRGNASSRLESTVHLAACSSVLLACLIEIKSYLSRGVDHNPLADRSDRLIRL
jgi:hypothetical protein